MAKEFEIVCDKCKLIQKIPVKSEKPTSNICEICKNKAKLQEESDYIENMKKLDLETRVARLEREIFRHCL